MTESSNDAYVTTRHTFTVQIEVEVEHRQGEQAFAYERAADLAVNTRMGVTGSDADHGGYSARIVGRGLLASAPSTPEADRG